MGRCTAGAQATRGELRPRVVPRAEDGVDCVEGTLDVVEVRERFVGNAFRGEVRRQAVTGEDTRSGERDAPAAQPNVLPHPRDDFRDRSPDGSKLARDHLAEGQVAAEPSLVILVDPLVPELEQHQVQPVRLGGGSVPVDDDLGRHHVPLAVVWRVRPDSVPIPVTSSSTSVPGGIASTRPAAGPARRSPGRSTGPRAARSRAALQAKPSRRPCRRSSPSTCTTEVSSAASASGVTTTGPRESAKSRSFGTGAPGRRHSAKAVNPPSAPSSPTTAASRGRSSSGRSDAIAAPGPTTAAGFANSNEVSSSNTRIDGGCRTGASSLTAESG